MRLPVRTNVWPKLNAHERSLTQHSRDVTWSSYISNTLFTCKLSNDFPPDRVDEARFKSGHPFRRLVTARGVGDVRETPDQLLKASTTFIHTHMHDVGRLFSTHRPGWDGTIASPKLKTLEMAKLYFRSRIWRHIPNQKTRFHCWLGHLAYKNCPKNNL